jgi:hypothetical protein
MNAFLILRPTADEIVKAAVTHSLLSDLSMALREIALQELPRTEVLGVRSSSLCAFQHVRRRTCRGFNAAHGRSSSPISMRAMERSESKLCATEVFVVSSAVGRRIRNALIA